MKTRSLIALTVLALAFTGAARSQSSENAQLLVGRNEKFPQWNSGDIALTQPVDFKEGDRLRIQLGGKAKRVVVRLLPKGEAPETSVGAIGIFEVPQNRIVEVTLTEERPQVIQVSVHGGPNPWGDFELGEDNGAATIVSASVVRKH